MASAPANEPVSFARHIKPLFRPLDRQAMRWAFDLWSYDEVAGRSHYTVGQAGWEEVADYALEWAEEHAVTRPAT